MPLAGAALLPSIVTHLGDVGSGVRAMTLADLVMSSASGYDLSVVAPRILTLDFRVPGPVAEALASDCGRFSCAAFQSVAHIQGALDNRDSFVWGLIRLYYAAFYAGHALIRTVGEGCSFFYKRHTDHIAIVADANGITPSLRMDSGVYHCTLNANSSAVTYLKAASSSGGTHEAFWLIFGNKLRSISDSILAGPLPRADAQPVFSKFDQVLRTLNRKGHYSWLSGVRNDLQYRLQHGTWFPETTNAHARRGLGRIASQWTRDPMTIDLSGHRYGILGDFSLTCAFIVSLCREVFSLIAERSSKGRRSFAAAGPLAYLNDIGVAA